MGTLADAKLLRKQLRKAKKAEARLQAGTQNVSNVLDGVAEAKAQRKAAKKALRLQAAAAASKPVTALAAGQRSDLKEDKKEEKSENGAAQAEELASKKKAKKRAKAVPQGAEDITNSSRPAKKQKVAVASTAVEYATIGNVQACSWLSQLYASTRTSVHRMYNNIFTHVCKCSGQKCIVRCSTSLLRAHETVETIRTILQAARAGRPVVKALYEPNPEVEALSAAEVEAWQAERGISVDGCSLRPIRSFAQSGADSQADFMSPDGINTVQNISH